MTGKQLSVNRVENDRVSIALVEEAIDVDSLRARVADPDVGAIGWFEGVTRRTTGDRITERLAYEAHATMAIAELEKLAERAVEKFSLHRCAIVHRLGEVPVGQASVVVACSSAHRPSTFAALPWIMDVLKRDVPIWKKEQYVDGNTQWVHPTDE